MISRHLSFYPSDDVSFRIESAFLFSALPARCPVRADSTRRGRSSNFFAGISRLPMNFRPFDEFSANLPVTHSRFYFEEREKREFRCADLTARYPEMVVGEFSKVASSPRWLTSRGFTPGSPSCLSGTGFLSRIPRTSTVPFVPLPPRNFLRDIGRFAVDNAR